MCSGGVMAKAAEAGAAAAGATGEGATGRAIASYYICFNHSSARKTYEYQFR